MREELKVIGSWIVIGEEEMLRLTYEGSGIWLMYGLARLRRCSQYWISTRE
jgi:hypothetical protein